MRAAIGDRITVRSHHIGEGERSGIVEMVEGPDGEPPYRIRWDGGGVSVFVPGSDAEVEHLPEVRSDDHS